MSAVPPVLRGYQDKTIDEARAKLAAGCMSNLIVCPTGGGKTVIASAIVRRAIALGKRVLFLAHRKELIDQTSAKLASFGVEHGIIMGAKRMALQHSVQVGSVQTVINRLFVIPKPDLIILDEAHHVTEGNTYAKICGAWPNAIIIGLTATPWRLDGKGLGDIFDSYVLVKTPRELRDEGYLVPVCGFEYEAPKTDDVKVQGGDFQAKSLDAAARVATLYGNIVSEWKGHAENGRTIVFCVSVAHAKELSESFSAAGVAAAYVHADTPKEERGRILGALRDGSIRVVCNVAVLTEGFDCPAVECVVLARPTLSTALFLQMCGRALRTVCLACGHDASWLLGNCPRCGSARVKRQARIHDHAGCLKKHGHPYSDRDFSPGASLEQTRNMSARRITDSWGNASGAFGNTLPPANPVLIRMLEDVKKTAIGAEGRPMTPAQREDELKRQAQWRARTFAERREIWERVVAKHGAVKAKGVYRFMSGFSDFVPRGWLFAALQREKKLARVSELEGRALQLTEAEKKELQQLKFGAEEAPPPDLGL